MAWKVKESGTMQVARRSEPWLTEAMLATYRQDLLPKYETTHGALMSILHDVQHTYGWIPEQAMEEIAAFLNISPSLVLDTVTFYEGYHNASSACASPLRVRPVDIGPCSITFEPDLASSLTKQPPMANLRCWRWSVWAPVTQLHARW